MTTPTIPTSADLQDIGQVSPLAGGAEAAAEGACDMCPHPSADHDAISARFCSATSTGAFSRGCVCRS